MKLKFKTQDFQTAAVNAVADLFAGQDKPKGDSQADDDTYNTIMRDKDINILHVMANESFAEFAESLQNEIEAETGIKFGIIQIDLFVGQSYEEVPRSKKSLLPSKPNKLLKCLEPLAFLTRAENRRYHQIRRSTVKNR